MALADLRGRRNLRLRAGRPSHREILRYSWPDEVLMYRCARCGAFNRVPEQRPAGDPVCGRCKATLELSGRPQEIDADGLARAVASSPVPVVVDFWAPWCGPCRTAAPILEQLGYENAGRYVVLKLNTDEHPGPAARLGIRGIPTFVVFHGGREVGRQSGVLPAPAMSRWVYQHAVA